MVVFRCAVVCGSVLLCCVTSATQCCVMWAVGGGLWAVGCGLWAVGFGLWAVGCGVWSLVFGQWLVVCGLWSVVCGLWSVDGGLWLVVHRFFGCSGNVEITCSSDVLANF